MSDKKPAAPAIAPEALTGEEPLEPAQAGADLATQPGEAAHTLDPKTVSGAALTGEAPPASEKAANS